MVLVLLPIMYRTFGGIMTRNQIRCIDRNCMISRTCGLLGFLIVTLGLAYLAYEGVL